MKLAVVSHKLCWPSESSPTGYATDGGFPFQIEAISELFDETVVVVPSERSPAEGLAPMKGRGMKLVPLSKPKGRGIIRKLGLPFWFITNGPVILREVLRSDAVHTPIPGDVGTIGMLFALLLRKPLFVRHCGNWADPRTNAERLWKWTMESFGGGRNVMLATGGSVDPPSRRNKNIRWIFSTSLRKGQMADSRPRTLPGNGSVRLVIACRQERRKGTDIVIGSMPAILERFPNATLDVIGGGSLLSELKELAETLQLNGSVRFHGKLEHSQVLDIFEQAHLFCYPTTASEGFPKVVLEALASGVPVITTPVSVLPELMKSGGGLVIPKAHPEDLASAVDLLCSDEAEYHKMSAKAIEVASQYSLEEWRDSIARLLREAWRMPLAVRAADSTN